jgi:hypothetical protein
MHCLRVERRNKGIATLFFKGKDFLTASSSMTRPFVKKCAQNCPNIAQNGALLNKNFCLGKLLVKIWEFKAKR